LAHPIFRLVDRDGILPVLFFEKEIKYPPLPGYLSRKIGVVPSFLHLAPVSFVCRHFFRTN
jgi:hypothetical protein